MSGPTLHETTVSTLLWAAGLSWLVPVMGSMTVLQCLVPADRLDWLGRLYSWGQVALTGSRWRAVVHPDVDPDRPYMFCQNHVNHFDHCTMYRATPHFKQGLELEEHFRYPVYGWFMRQRGTIPVRRGSQGQTPEIMTRMREEIDRGHSILAFPEGTRTRDGRVGPFHKGVFYIARDLGIPVVPVAVTGMQEVMRADSWIIRPGRTVTVYCERPVPTAGIPDEEIPALAERVREPIRRRVDRYCQEREGL
jgi:1-acyl-sn-glycerol-3-phosphate acyltransferase